MDGTSPTAVIMGESKTSVDLPAAVHSPVDQIKIGVPTMPRASSSLSLPASMSSKTKTAMNKTPASAADCLKKLIFGLIHLIFVSAYELVSFGCLVLLTMALMNCIPRSVGDSHLKNPVRKTLAFFFIDLILVTYVQVPLEKRFCRTTWMARYLKNFRDSATAAFLMNAAQVFAFGVSIALLLVLYEGKLCQGFTLDSWGASTGREIGASILNNPGLTLLYVSILYPVTVFVKVFQWVQPRSSCDILSEYMKCMFNVFFPWVKFPIDEVNDFVTWMFEAAEFVGVILIPTYAFTLWHNSFLPQKEVDTGSFPCLAYVYYLVSAFLMTYIAVLLTSAEAKITGLWTYLVEETQARLLVNMAIFLISLIKLLDMYFVVNKEESKEICLTSFHMSIYSAPAIKYVALSSFCFYAAVKSLLILSSEVEHLVKILKMEQSKKAVLKNVRTAKPFVVETVKTIELQEKKSTGKSQIYGSVHEV